MKQSDFIKVDKKTGTCCIETFRKVSSYEIHSLYSKEPSCFNSIVSVKRYKITIEEIVESKEVIAERLQKLWDECDNYHHWTPLKNEATAIGYELVGSPGNKINRKNSNNTEYH